MSKKLITAETIRDIKAKGQTQIEVSVTNCIVTPEAREVAEQLDIVIVDAGNATNTTACSRAVTNNTTTSSSSNCSSLNENELKVIRQAVIEKLPKGAMISDSLIDQLVCRAVKENKQAAIVGSTTTTNSSSAKPLPIKLVKGSAVPLDIFEGAGKEKKVGIADVVTDADNSSMAAGYMQWERAFFPWTLNYDEVDVILEGELHIRHDGKTIIGKAGDIIFIPKGSSIEFGTPTNVRFVYVAWPANWQQQ